MRVLGPSNTIALDWGSSVTRVWLGSHRDKTSPTSELFRLEKLLPQWEQPSVLALDAQTNKILAIGREAEQMEGRVNTGVTVMRPWQRGRVYDQNLAEKYIHLIWRNVFQSRFWWQPVVGMSIPASSTVLDRIVYSTVIDSVGAQQIVTIAQPLAAAIGAGVPVADASGSFILHIGHEHMEAAVISLGSIVEFRQSWHAGKWLVDQIVMILRANHHLIISKQVAEQLLSKVATLEAGESRELLVTGQDVITHSPREIQVNAQDLMTVVQQWSEEVAELVQDVLAAVPPELTTDIIDKGMLMSGGVAQLEGLNTHLTSQLGMLVTVVDEPERAVIKGVALVVRHAADYERSLAYVTT